MHCEGSYLDQVDTGTAEFDTTHQDCFCFELLNLEKHCCASVTIALSPALNVSYDSLDHPQPLTPFLRASLKCLANTMQHAEGFGFEREIESSI